MTTNLIKKTQDEAASLVRILEVRAQHTPDQIAYGMLDVNLNITDITYAELFARVCACSAQLAMKYVVEGERCLLMFQQGIDFIVSFLACHRIGAIPIPCNMVNRSKSLAKWESIAANAQVTCIVTDANSINTIESSFKKSERLSSLPIFVEQKGAASDRETVKGYNELALLQYTSGSTGNPKGVMVTHSSLLNNLKQLDAKFEFNERSIMVSWLPFYHDMGLIIGILQGLYSGYKVILMKPVDFMQQPLSWLRAISMYGATHTGAPNFAYELAAERLVDSPSHELEGISLSSLERAFCGAEPIHLNTLLQFIQAAKLFGLREDALCPGYGLAEASLVVSTYSIEQQVGWIKLNRTELQRGSVSILDRGVIHFEVPLPDESTMNEMYLVGNGFVIHEHQLSIRDCENGTVLGDHAIGEVWFSGPSVTKGYWNRDEDTKRVFVHDEPSGQVYLRTGDLGFTDTNGELYMTGRMKDLVIIRGMNYYPQDIERTSFLSDPDLRTDGAAAFSINDGGEERLIVIQEVSRSAVRHLQCDTWAQQIRADVLHVHGIPVECIVFIPPMHVPRTTSGKIQRSKAKNMYINNEWSKVLGTSSAEEIRKEIVTLNEFVSGIHSEEDWAQYMVALLAHQLAVPTTEVSRSLPFTELGINSMMSLSIRESLEQALGCTVPAAALFNYNTVEQMSEYLYSLAAGRSSRDTLSAPAVIEGNRMELSDAELDNCSEEELFELLKKELGGQIHV
ncbi:AMP-binding protein [Paenibacillus sp. CAU 1523]|uniref:AMP-binding protein n=2 Tax=Paenibacillus arenosi TaxID=2774142 RepID=A0ABR9B0C9_9BACL|nr:AMP-binding protein [Paenibacillus arenosi]